MLQTVTRPRRTLMVLVAALMCAAGAVALAPTIAAQASDTEVFEGPGEFEYVVGEDVCTLEVEAYGAQGGTGHGDGGAPGLGGGALAFVDVTPGEVLDVTVGGRGGDGATDAVGEGGFNGGGVGGDEEGVVGAGGGGGGMSDVSRSGEFLVVAGGGGGGGGNDGGEAGDGGAGGGNGTDGGSVAGGPVGGSSGGNGGLGGDGWLGGDAGGNGSTGQGGAGGYGEWEAGGGGGGGYLGGGGGGATSDIGLPGGGGGGGGSGFTPDGTGMVDGVNGDNGWVLITPIECDEPPVPPTPVVPTDPGDTAPADVVRVTPRFTG